MTERMQQVLAGLGVLIVCGLLWMLLVSPARDDAAAAQESQQAAETQAAQVDGQLAQARQAAQRAPGNVRALKRLAVAVPEQVEAAQLIDQLDRTAKRFKVTFDVLKVSDGAASAASAPAPSGDASSPTVAADGTSTSTTATTPTPAPAASTGATSGATAPTAPGSIPIGLSVQVSGSYVAVTKFVDAIQTVVRPRGTGVTARGRLLRVNAIDLKVDDKGGRDLAGTLDITAYLLPRQEAATPAATSAPGDQP